MIPTTAQATILSDTHRFRVVNCGRRFGKTTLAVEDIKGFALHKACRIAYIAPTFAQARDIAWQMLIRELKPIIIGSPNETRLELKVRNIKKTESTIILRGWEAIETLRGQQFDFIIIDEIASMRNFWLNWQEVVRPTLTDTRGQALFISTPKGFNHFYDLYNLESKDEDYKSFHFTSYDNPNIPKDEIDKASQEITEDRFAQEYLADFRKTEGLVYKEFNREKHVNENEPTTIEETILGVDFGYTNPASIIPIRIDQDNHYWIREEWYKSKQTTEQIAEQANLYKSTKCYPDPAEPDRIAILKKAGLNCREVSKDIVAGVDHVREMFKQNRIHIHPDCKNLIYELETYRYPDKKPEQNEAEKPVKENDHALDALRYALYNIKKPVKDIIDPYFEQVGTYYTD
jgi:PBSX family phage terminase large subunit